MVGSNQPAAVHNNPRAKSAVETRETNPLPPPPSPEQDFPGGGFPHLQTKSKKQKLHKSKHPHTHTHPFHLSAVARAIDNLGTELAHSAGETVGLVRTRSAHRLERMGMNCVDHHQDRSPRRREGARQRQVLRGVCCCLSAVGVPQAARGCAQRHRQGLIWGCSRRGYLLQQGRRMGCSVLYKRNYCL